jgi:hypothetical protein
MKISRITRLSSAQRMIKHPAYALAKTGDMNSARRLVADLLHHVRFKDADGYICPVVSQIGNRIPLAMADYISERTSLTPVNDIYLIPSHHGTSMTERLCYQPEFCGQVRPGKYIIVDDCYTTGSTLIHLKNYIECWGGDIRTALTIGSSFSTLFEPSTLMLRLLQAKFPDVSEYFDLSYLTVPHITYLMRFQSLNRFHSLHYQHLQTKSFSY